MGDHQLICNTVRPRQNRWNFPDDIFKGIFSNENVWILIKISLKLALKFRVNNITAFVQIMTWLRPGDKPSSEPTMVRLQMHICIYAPLGLHVLTQNILQYCHMDTPSSHSQKMFNDVLGSKWFQKHQLCMINNKIYSVLLFILIRRVSIG